MQGLSQGGDHTPPFSVELKISILWQEFDMNNSSMFYIMEESMGGGRMMRALFIGGTGTISTAVSRLAVELGWELYLLNRGNLSERVLMAPESSSAI